MPLSVPASLASYFIVVDRQGMSSKERKGRRRPPDLTIYNALHGKMGGMIRKSVPSKVLLGLIVAGLVLPMTICVVVALAWLLPAMGDSQGGKVLSYVALALGIVWIVVLIALVLVQAIRSLGRSEDADP